MAPVFSLLSTMAALTGAVLPGRQGVLYLNKSLVPVWGETAPKAVVTVVVNGRVVAQAKADAEGRYFFPQISLQEGPNTVEVEARRWGKATRRVLFVVVDTKPPSLEVERPSEGAILVSKGFVVEGMTEPGSEVEVLVDGERAGSAPAGPGGRFSVELRDVRPGRRRIEVVARDGAGNASSAKFSVTVDTTPPPLDISSPKVGEVIPRRTLFVRGFTEPGAEVLVKAQGVEVGKATADSRGAFEVGPVTFESEGRAKISLTVKDKAGWTRTVERFVSLDFTPPPIEVRFPPPGRPLEGPKGELVVLTEPGAKVSLKAGGKVVAEAAADERGLAVLSEFPLLPGKNRFTIEAADRAGHVRQQELVLVFDRTREELRRLGYPEETIEAVERAGRPRLRTEFK